MKKEMSSKNYRIKSSNYKKCQRGSLMLECLLAQGIFLLKMNLMNPEPSKVR